jgi:hypothetical protein
VTILATHGTPEAPLRLFATGHIEATTESRTLGGEVVRYGRVGFTSIGPLRVRAGALRLPEDVTRVKLTEDHNRAVIRGYATSLLDSSERLYARCKASADADGDLAIAEAIDHKRDGFSLDVVNGVIEEADDGEAPWLVSADLIAIGQVGLPAFFEGSRIDQVAASAATTPEGTTSMTEEQRTRLAELRALNNRTEEQEAEYATLTDLAVAEATTPADAAPADSPADSPADAAAATSTPVAASLPNVPGSIPRPRAAVTTSGRGGALDQFITAICQGFRSRHPQSIGAALTDVTNTGAGADINMPAWSGELWSGVAYEPEFIPLLNQGTLTNYEGKGWRFVTKPVMQDYAGDKAAVPSGPITTEPSTYEAFRKAVGHDIDRKFYDFPDEAFLRAYVEAVRESWLIETDAEVEAWIGANAVDSTVAIPAGSTQVLKAVAAGRRKVKRAKMGKATFAIVGDDAYDTLMDLAEVDLPAFLALFGVDPENFTSSALPAYAGKVVVGTKMAATYRTLPGSPIRVSAQHIANGGIDEGFFGYWAVEQHSETGIQFVTLTP